MDSDAEPIIGNMSALVEAFRSKGCPIMWSAWSRQFDDGISNAMDRWYGSRGLRADEPENAVYIFEGAPGLEPLKELAPTAEERTAGCFYHGKMLDMFWLFQPDVSSRAEKVVCREPDQLAFAGLPRAAITPHFFLLSRPMCCPGQVLPRREAQGRRCRYGRHRRSVDRRMHSLHCIRRALSRLRCGGCARRRANGNG